MLLEVGREEIHHGLDAVLHVRIVLRIAGADIPAHRLVDVAVLEHHAEEGHHDVLVGLGRGRARGRDRQGGGGNQHTEGQRFQLHTHTGRLRS
ncbi:hypothetical protein D9M70_617630 [compost metagenome]